MTISDLAPHLASLRTDVKALDPDAIDDVRGLLIHHLKHADAKGLEAHLLVLMLAVENSCEEGWDL